jgi:hypothetical protein
MVKLLISTIIIGTLFCNYQEPKNKKWLNVDYINCLKSDLPCACQKKVGKFYALTLDTNKLSKNYGVSLAQYRDREPSNFLTKRTLPNTYDLFKNDKDDTIRIGKLIINKKELNFIYNDLENLHFLLSPVQNLYEYQYEKQNVFLINKLLKSRGYLTLEDILNEDSLSCSCNKDFGNINLIISEGGKKYWIIEKEMNSFLIYNTNRPDGPDDTLKKELFIKLN